MKILILSLLLLFVVALVAGLIRQWWYQRNRRELPAVRMPRPDGCCGQHEVCEKDSLLAAVSRQVEYYEDEELDAFRGRPADAYDDNEIERFQEVLYTMRDDEVAGWVRSLQLRGVALPDELKDEVFMIIGERRERAGVHKGPAGNGNGPSDSAARPSGSAGRQSVIGR